MARITSFYQHTKMLAVKRLLPALCCLTDSNSSTLATQILQSKKNHNFLQDEDLSSQLSISKAVDIKLTRVGHLVKCTQTLLSCPPKWMKRQLRNNILNKDKIDAGDETQEMRVHIFGSVRSPGGGHGNPLQYSCLENPKERGAWQFQSVGVTNSWTQWKWLSTQNRWGDRGGWERVFFSCEHKCSYLGRPWAVITAQVTDKAFKYSS